MGRRIVEEENVEDDEFETTVASISDFNNLENAVRSDIARLKVDLTRRLGTMVAGASAFIVAALKLI